MRVLLTEDFVEIPDDGKCLRFINLNSSDLCEIFSVKVTTKARKVTVSGPRGEVTKDFSHLAVELQRMNQNNKKKKGKFIRIRMWFGGYKQACSVNTLKSLIENMITGVTEVSHKPYPVLRTECPFLLGVWCVLFSPDSI